MDAIALEQARTAHFALGTITSAQLTAMGIEVSVQVRLAHSNLSLLIERLEHPRRVAEECPVHHVTMKPLRVHRMVVMNYCPVSDCMEHGTVQERLL